MSEIRFLQYFAKKLRYKGLSRSLRNVQAGNTDAHIFRDTVSNLHGRWQRNDMIDANEHE
jgi:hypothetical protein